MILFEEWQNNFYFFYVIFYCFVGKFMCIVARLNLFHSTEIISTEIKKTREIEEILHIHFVIRENKHWDLL